MGTHNYCLKDNKSPSGAWFEQSQQVGTYVSMEATWEYFTISYKFGSINLIAQLLIRSHPRAMGKASWQNETLYNQGYIFCVTWTPKLGGYSLVGLNWNKINKQSCKGCIFTAPSMINVMHQNPSPSKWSLLNNLFMFLYCDSFKM